MDTFIKYTSSDQDLEISIQETPYGLIINDILLPENNWHSIISEKSGVSCMVCDVTVDKSEDHIKLKTHVDNLNKYKPLKEFDFTITRKIGDNYQCVICNAILNVSNIEKHYKSKEHLDQILYSANRAFDILDFELQNDTKIDYSDNRISNDSDVNESESVIPFNDNIMSSVDRENDDRSDMCPKKKSYALILKESTKLDDEEVKLEDDSRHMIMTRGNEEFYCMVCVSFDDISNKTKHYTNKEHLEKLNECTIIEKYKQYFVRQVNDNYYHCGVCNSLQYIFYIDDHIRLVHNSKKSNTNQEKTQENINTKNQINADNETRNLCNENINHESNENLMYMNLNTSSIRLYKLYMHLHQFQYKLRVSFISYNFICQLTNAYSCGICNFLSSEFYMTQHITKRRHMEKVAKIPFLTSFGQNLIRMVKQVSHCAICNCFFVTRAYKHTLEHTHIRLLKAATIKSPNHTNNVPKQQLQMNQLAIESTSTNQTKIDVNESSEKQKKIDVNESKGKLTKVEEPYNFEYIYLKFKNTYVKVSYKSYNGLINIGDGSHFCFLCSLRVFGSFKEHMEDENHLIHLNSCHFIDKYDKHLLRQNSLAYHCCSCNIMFTKGKLSAHMTWKGIEIKSDKKTRKEDLKSGIKQINIKTIQESAVSNVESKIRITRIDVKKADGNVEIKKC